MGRGVVACAQPARRAVPEGGSPRRTDWDALASVRASDWRSPDFAGM